MSHHKFGGTLDARKRWPKPEKQKTGATPRWGGIDCESNRKEWRAKENAKNRTIIKAKQETLKKHIDGLNPKSSSTKTWAFAKAWTSGTQQPDLTSSPIINPATKQAATHPKEKAEILAAQYDHQPTVEPDEEALEDFINEKINSLEPTD